MPVAGVGHLLDLRRSRSQTWDVYGLFRYDLVKYLSTTEDTEDAEAHTCQGLFLRVLRALRGGELSMFFTGTSVISSPLVQEEKKMRRMARWIAVVLLVAAVSADDNWPQFRGPKSGVAADDPALPDTWSATENVVWKIDVAGRGWSSPVVWGDHIYYTLFDRGLLTCHDAKTGKEIYGRQRIAADAAGSTSSPWAYNGKIFASLIIRTASKLYRIARRVQ
jgi:hypothetical protein